MATSFTNAGDLSPAQSQFQSNDLAIEFLTALRVRGAPDLATRFWESQLGVSAFDYTTLPDNETARSCRAVEALHRDDASAALTHSTFVADSTNSVFAIDGALLQLRAHIQNGDIGSALELTAWLASRHPQLRAILPVSDIFGGREFKSLRPHLKRMALSIACELHYRQTGAEADRNYLKWACDEFVVGNELSRPSEVRNRIEQFDADQVRYFLEHVCTVPTLQACRTLRSSRDAEHERLNVLSALASLAPERREQYRDEITSLAARAVLEEGVRIVEKSRIFVETAELLRQQRRDLSDIFDQYLAARTPNPVKDQEFESALRALTTLGRDLPTQYLQLPNDEADALLIEIVENVKREFYTNPDYGLEKYLSMRIRHGTLAGTLRGPLDAARLTTTKTSQGYSANDYWMAKARVELGQSASELVGGILAKLTEAYDKLLDEKLRPLIRAKSDSTGPAPALGGPLNPPIFHALRREAGRVPDFDTFLEVVLQVLLSHLDKGLGLLRRQLSDAFGEGLQQVFGEAEAALRSLPDSRFSRELGTSLRQGRTNCTFALNRVEGWLTLNPSDFANETYSAQQVVDVAVESARRTLLGFHFESAVSTSSPQTEMSRFGPSVVSVVADILFIIVENACKHSGLSPTRISISIRHEPDNETLHLSITSDSKDSEFEATSKAILEVRDLLSSGRFQDRATTEGRSGLIKIHKTVSRSAEGYLDFAFKGRTQFVVKVGLKLISISGSGKSEVMHD
jgi:hypothetical protein